MTDYIKLDADEVTRQIDRLIADYPELAEDESLRADMIVMPGLAARLLSRTFVKGGDDCWEWQGAKDYKGYGHIRVDGILNRTHRASYKAFKDMDLKSLHVLHKCDNPSCIRPSHLFLGTNKENMEDRERKGRGVRISGPKHHNYTVTFPMHLEIREAYAKGEKQRDIGARLGISQYAVWWNVHHDNQGA